MNALTSILEQPAIVAPTDVRADRSVVARSNGWTTGRVAAGAVFLIGGLWAGRGAWEDVLRIATRDEEASHIWLVPFLCAWLVWQRRESLLAGVRPTSSLLGPMLVAAGWAMAHWGFNGAKQSPLHVGALLVAIGAVVTVLGARVLVHLWPALLLLAFIVPVPGMVRQRISIPLEQVTAGATATLLRWLGAPIERSANVITINGHPVTVAEACNGLRMVFPLLMIVYVFCFTLPLKPAVRWLLMLTSPVSAVLCNILRLIPTIYLYGYVDNATDKARADAFHNYSGWVMLPVAFMALWGLIKLLEAFGFSVMTGPASAAKRFGSNGEGQRLATARGVTASC